MTSKTHLQVELELPLDRFRLEVKFSSDARITGIFGASGCGKTSLLESIAGLRPGATGLLRWADQDWSNAQGKPALAPERREIGYVPQDGLLFPRRSVRANLMAGRSRALKRGIDFEATFWSTLELLELAGLLEQAVETLSGGERQRVSLARALCSGPRFLLLDEPLSSLDLPLRRRLLPYLWRVAHEFELPILLVSHDPLEVQALCGQLIVLDAGRVIASGEPRQVLTRPEVFPLAASQGFLNLLPARVRQQQSTSSELQLGDAEDGPCLITPRSNLEPGQRLLVSIPSIDIILATTRPTNISARNILKAQIAEVECVGDQRLIRALVHPSVPSICVEVTAMTARELKLIPGSSVYLLIKSVACQLYDSVPMPESRQPSASIQMDKNNPGERYDQ